MALNYKIVEAQLSHAEGISFVHVQSWKETYAGIVPQSYIEAQTLESRCTFWKKYLTNKPSRYAVYVALDAHDRVVGFSSAGPASEIFTANGVTFDSELYAIYLLKEFQKYGIGRQLFLKAAEDLVHHKFKSMILWVQAGSPTCNFYQHMDGKLYCEKSEDWEGSPIKDLAYGWENQLAISTSIWMESYTVKSPKIGKEVL